MQGGKGYQECSARTDGKTQASEPRGRCCRPRAAACCCCCCRAAACVAARCANAQQMNASRIAHSYIDMPLHPTCWRCSPPLPCSASTPLPATTAPAATASSLTKSQTAQRWVGRWGACVRLRVIVCAFVCVCVRVMQVGLYVRGSRRNPQSGHPACLPARLPACLCLPACLPACACPPACLPVPACPPACLPVPARLPACPPD
jgi:hypothetical protein